MTEQRVVEASQEIDATPDAVFRALIHPLELSYWFCHHAWTEPRVGGDFHVRWRNGWWARGVYQMVERPRRIELTWQGRDEPGETTLAFEIKTLGQGVAVRVIHSGYGAGALWDKAVAEAEISWPLALDNLESVLTTGVDKRLASRPELGIIPEELTPERADRKGIRVDSGIYLAGVLEEGGAAEAGLQKGDVIISVGAMGVSDTDSLTTTLASYRVGDRVRVGFVRGRELGTAVVKLKSRPIPDVSFDPQQLVERVREDHSALIAELRQTLDGLSEEKARNRPSTGEWSVQEILGHLSLSERITQHRFANIIVGTTVGQIGGDVSALPEALAMALSTTPTVGALLDRIEQETEETFALFAALRPEILAMKARYHQMARGLLVRSFHIRDHLDQIKAMVEAVEG